MAISRGCGCTGDTDTTADVDRTTLPKRRVISRNGIDIAIKKGPLDFSVLIGKDDNDLIVFVGGGIDSKRVSVSTEAGFVIWGVFK